jgi:hydroxypyruvate isomerase
MLFTEVPFFERFARAAAAGFGAVEYQYPYGHAIADIRARLDEARIPLIQLNLPSGNWDKGERGIACHPDRQAEFRQGLEQGIPYARALGVPQLNCLAGIAPAGVPDAVIRQTLVENLRHAASEFKKAGLRLVVEPINTFDMPGFWLNRASEAVSVLDEVGADNAYVQFDIYHAQRMVGELAATIERYLPRIGHIQIADNPGRHEPGTGEINYPYLMRLLDRLGYKGWVSAEYRPATTTEAGLGWLSELAA